MPTITGIGGTLTEGGTLTLAGSFGSKAQPAPIVFDKLDDGQPPDVLVTESINADYTATTERRPRRAHSARSDAKTDSYHYFKYNDRTSRRWYAAYGIFIDTNNEWGTGNHDGGGGFSNIKFLRFFPTGDSSYCNVGMAAHTFDGGSDRWDYFFEPHYDNGGFGGPVGMAEAFTFGTWVQVQCEFIESSRPDANDAVLRVWVRNAVVGGHRVLDCTDGMSLTSENQNEKRPFIVGFYDSWGPSNAQAAHAYLYFQDVAIDDTLARVELGDQADYDRCTWLEYQPATSWRDDAIACTLNLGALQEGGPMFVFVTDAEGNRSAGTPLAIGGVAPPIDITEPPPEVTEPPPEVTEPPPSFTGSREATAELLVTDQPALMPDFSLQITPIGQTIAAGETATYQITVVAVGGFADSVHFSVTGSSTGTSEVFDPPGVAGAGTVTLTIATNQHGGVTPNGINMLTVTGQSAGLQHSASAWFNIVTVAANGQRIEAPDFALSVEPSSQTIRPGDATSYTITVTPSGAFAGEVRFSVTGCSTGTSEVFDPPTVRGGGTSVLTITSTPATPVGTNTVKVTGTT